ncbi:MAG TPA: EAL domain-containing protein, partial [Aquabacterium sp.]|uniref:EAL domain-containing protein n=1 Tax=Aquabacterium sp. TaxID=1872578 RepID=UPI002E36656A
VKGVIGLASTLGMDVTAEGVEDEGQRSFLCQEGCTYLQGYGIARPMPAEDMARWMRERVASQV